MGKTTVCVISIFYIYIHFFLSTPSIFIMPLMFWIDFAVSKGKTKNKEQYNPYTIFVKWLIWLVGFIIIRAVTFLIQHKCLGQVRVTGTLTSWQGIEFVFHHSYFVFILFWLFFIPLVYNSCLWHSGDLCDLQHAVSLNALHVYALCTTHWIFLCIPFHFWLISPNQLTVIRRFYVE